MLTEKHQKANPFWRNTKTEKHKGDQAKGQALKNAGTGAADSNALMTEGQSIEGGVLPFLKEEVTNPQGFGQQTLGQMTTAADQSAAGSLSQANEAAKLRAARTGNQAGGSAIIDAAARSGGKSMVDANLETNIANAQEKMKQQQAGAAGMESLAGTNIGDSLKALGISDEAVNAWSGANKSAGNVWSNAFLPVITAGEQAAGQAAAGGAFG